MTKEELLEKLADYPKDFKIIVPKNIQQEGRDLFECTKVSTVGNFIVLESD